MDLILYDRFDLQLRTVVMSDRFVLLLRRKTSANMSFLLIYLKNVLDLFIKLGIFTPEPFAHVLMNRAFAYAEVLCCGTDCCFIFCYVASEDNTSLIRLYFQNTTPREIISLIYMPWVCRK